MDEPEHRHRKKRMTFNDAGHAHELTFSCYQRMPLLDADRCRIWFLDSLDAARRKLNFEIWAYLIMPEHAHVLLLPRADVYEVSTILTAIKLPVARRAVQ